MCETYVYIYGYEDVTLTLTRMRDGHTRFGYYCSKKTSYVSDLGYITIRLIRVLTCSFASCIAHGVIVNNPS